MIRGSVRHACQLTFRYLPYVLVIAFLFSPLVRLYLPAYVGIGAVVLAFVLQIVLFAKFSNVLASGLDVRAVDALRNNAFNVIIVVLVLATPGWVLKGMLRLFDSVPMLGLALHQLLELALAVVTLYVLPVVFLKRLGLMAVPLGIVYLFSRLRQSVYLVGLVVLQYGLGLSIWALYFSADLGVLPMIVSGISIITTWLTFVIFAAATIERGVGAGPR